MDNLRTQGMDDKDAIRLGKEFEKEMNIRNYKIGNADIGFISQIPLVDWATAWMEIHRG